MADYEDVNGVEIETEPEDIHFIKEYGKSVTCMVQWLFCNQKDPNTTQRHQIFYSRCLIKNKVGKLIIDNESYENIVSNTLVHYLN